MNENVEQHPFKRRKSPRITVNIPVDVMFGTRRHAIGKVVNISRDGIRVEVSPVLIVGQLYRFNLHNFGIWPGVVVERYNVNRHGVRFTINEGQKRKIDEDILGF